MRDLVVAGVLLALPPWGAAQKAVAPTPGETRVERVMTAAADDPLRLRALLVRMPKGADLHMHFSGAVYAETMLAEARADLMCVDPATKSLAVNHGTTRSLPPQPVCGEGRRRVEEAFTDQALYDSLIDSFSMRSFVPSAGVSGHDQFFATFDRFDPTHAAGSRHGGEWMDEIATRAAAQNEQYLEVMHTPDLRPALALAGAYRWPTEPAEAVAYGQDVTGTEERQLAAARTAMMASPEFEAAVTADSAEFAAVLAGRRERERCGTAAAGPGCAVDVRFLFQVLRANPPAAVFAQTLLAFEIATREAARGGEARVVGLNFVQPEDGRVAMAEYTRQMRMIGYLHRLYPTVHISLHAGELVEGMVPPEGLRFHIRQAVEIAGAERIGHGVDVMNEDDAAGLLGEMAARGVAVEINLTSNDVILGVSRARQPLAVYRAAGVPVAISTDDEGVSRIDLTHEYVRAATDFRLDYRALKGMARTSLEHSFLPGASLWQAPDRTGERVAVCRASGVEPDAGCSGYLKANPRAAAEWEAEQRFGKFEASVR